MSAEKRKEIAEKIRSEVGDMYLYTCSLTDEKCEWSMDRRERDLLDDILDDMYTTIKNINELLDKLDDWRDAE